MHQRLIDGEHSLISYCFHCLSQHIGLAAARAAFGPTRPWQWQWQWQWQ